MSGRASKQKGYRNEIAFRQEARKYGFKSDRVPCSGSIPGLSGDVTLEKDGIKWKAEVKSRKDLFTPLYVLFEYLTKLTGDDKIELVINGTLVSFSTSLLGVLEDHGVYTIHTYLKDHEKYKRGFKQLISLQKWVKDCDFIAVKNDRQGFLYARFRHA